MMSISSSSSSVGVARLGHVVGDHQLERRGLDDLVDGHARVHRTQPHRVVGRLEVEHAQVRDDPADLVEPVAGRPDLAHAVVAGARHHVDGLDEAAESVVGHPVAGGVVDEVAGGSPQAEQLRLRPAPVADGGDVLVAVAVDLGGAHHDVAPTRPDDVEDGPVRDVALDHPGRVGDADRQRVRGKDRHRVGHHHVGCEGRLREATADDRAGADGVDEDVAVAAETLGDGDDTDVGSVHDCAPVVRASTAAR